MHPEELERAADIITNADALLVAAGAGMGVDSGLPDFRGDAGFWAAYPPYRKLDLTLSEIADPELFERDPELVWGFYGHRRNLYRTTAPHRGFAILRRFGQRVPSGVFVYTSNIDGAFQKAGFDDERIVECHGSIDFNQCVRACGIGIFPAGPETIEIDETSMRARTPLPTCPNCGAMARPNMVMIGDWNWEGERTARQSQRMAAWLASLVGARVVAIECGAGTAIPAVRLFCERNVGPQSLRPSGTLIRINPLDPQVPPGQLGFAGGALAVLEALDEVVYARAHELDDR
jgi:NAD-dependent SIR2 family protein deacetylase